MKQLGISVAPRGPADLDEAHPAHADRLHARVVAEARDEGPGPLGGGDQHLALAGADGPAVERELDLLHGASSGPVAVVAWSVIGAAPLLDVDQELVAEHA